MDKYKHKSGAVKRKERNEREEKSKKGQTKLTSFSITSNKSSKNLDDNNLQAEKDNAPLSGCNIDSEKGELIGTQNNTLNDNEESNLKNSTVSEEKDVRSSLISDEDCELSDTSSDQAKENLGLADNLSFDVGNFQNLYISTSEIEKIVRFGPEKNPKKFPKDAFGCRFPINLLKITLPNGDELLRDWFFWSRKKEAFYCFPCRLFCKLPESQRSSMSMPNGYKPDKGWKKLYDRLGMHENSTNHKSCYIQWRALEKRLKNSSTVHVLLTEQIKNEAKRWRQLLAIFFDVTLFLAERGLAFRGKNALIGDPHNGNYLGILELISHYHPLLEEHLVKVKESQSLKKRLQVHYLSPEIQNEFLQTCASQVTLAILNERASAKYYSIIVDATPDSAHVEQTTFILRFVWLNEKNQYEIHERFLEFSDCNGKTGEDIANLIKSTLEKHGIPLADCRGQGYDNGSNMSGRYKGAQSLILKENPLAIFSPCACHTLNLCGNDAAECCSEAVTFFGVVQKIYNIFSKSTQRWEILLMHTSSSLHSMCETRWSSRTEAIKPFVGHNLALRNAIEEVETMTLKAETRADLAGVKKYLQSFEGLVMASIWFKILTSINQRTVVLQARNATIDVEVSNLKSLLEDLQFLRDNWDKILNECKTVAKNINIKPFFNEKRKRVKMVTGDLQGNPENNFKINVFFKIIDNVMCNMAVRFESIKAIEERFNFLWNYLNLSNEDLKEKAEKFCKLYVKDVSLNLVDEVEHLKKIHKDNIGEKSAKPFELLNLILELGMVTIFPNICTGLRIFVTLPVTVAEGERSFSALNRIKDIHRSTMCQGRLNSLGILAMEPFLARQLNSGKLIDHFADQKARKAFTAEESN